MIKPRSDGYLFTVGYEVKGEVAFPTLLAAELPRFYSDSCARI